MFSRYTERAQRVVVLAQDEARRLQRDYVGSEHLLLGLLREGEGVAAKALQSMGVDLDRLRAAVEQALGRGEKSVSGEIGFTPPAKRVMVEWAIEESRAMGHNYVGTEHLLLGLLHAQEDPAVKLLSGLGVELAALRQQVLHLLGTPPRREVPGPETSVRWVPILPLADVVRHVLLPLASSEAKRLGASAIGPEHLLLGLLRDAAPSRAADLLREKGITLEWLRERLEDG